MKYVIVIGDGMADYPIASLGGKTPLEAADTPNFDFIASHGITGTMQTVPDGMVPESDTANLAIMGYDPKIYSHGRSPLEAASMGIDLKPHQTAIRANLVALSDDGKPYDEKIMLDHSSSEIPTEEARVLIEYCDEKLCGVGQKLYTGVSYRHCFVYDNAPEFTDFSRPHDILGRQITDYLPRSESSAPFLELMRKSFDILNDHPLNIERAQKGLKKANSLWFWSPGKKPLLPSFKEKTGLDGSVICAVDLIKGIGKCACLDTPYVEGATGGCVTDYTAKVNAAIRELESGKDFVYIHVEAPDECGHKGDVDAKIAAIENIDKKIVGVLLEKLSRSGEPFRIAVLPDHPTPISLRTHARDPIPFAVYSSEKDVASPVGNYSEASARTSGIHICDGSTFIERFINDNFA